MTFPSEHSGVGEVSLFVRKGPQDSGIELRVQGLRAAMKGSGRADLRRWGRNGAEDPVLISLGAPPGEEVSSKRLALFPRP